MSKQVTTKLRQSASLILLAKDRNATPPNFDYNVCNVFFMIKTIF